MPDTTLHTPPLRPGAFPSTAARAGLTGFPSPAENYAERTLDLNECLVKHPAATFFMRVEGHSMQAHSIHHGDILVVDRAVSACFGHIVVAPIDGEILVKRLEQRHGRAFLCSGHPDHAPIPINERSLQIWGVVRSVIHEFPL
ncbi:LexA family protein [Halomonas caseinilytica]|uniref:DNA polymerase V n=1 Tax=Halomonas caseinilytica TaxID=438744 RepID=A0A1M6XG78_9GAMM|nr:translesion error-prone DNA polymerase V autoproteolytic subunit [Halomonas caseinilytica]SEM71196.1 SOS response UmuD protein. Serine peptidase. MEROPS family S24 [Halomonas caseinilytica]SHL04815.1 DNA polymerase V [Halomonas caseinilytica]